jgi:hypothetical protein
MDRGVDRMDAETWGNNGIAEIALRLGCATTTAENYVAVGEDLRDRLPLVQAAFAAGDIDFARAARISHTTSGFTTGTVTAVEAEAVAAALRLAPRALGAAIDRMLIRVSPDEYAALRENEQQISRRVRKRRVGILDRIEADLTPDEAAALWQRIHEVAATVCEHDRRGKQYRLVDAYMALVHGETRLTCTCGRDTCPRAGTPMPSRRKPLVQVTTSIATLLGLSSDPGYLAGYGPIDPKLVRTLAQDATWQGMLTDLLETANHHLWGAPDTGFDPISDDALGHGVPAAVRYRPDAGTVALVRSRDQHCRFPGYTVDARRCELDHVAPFDPAAPDLGGLTIASNLQCLCKFHHQLKTAGLWRATAAPDGAIAWTSSYGECHTTAPNGAHLAMPAYSLTPTVLAGPVIWRPPIEDEPPPF